jgi:hypothetical protein
MRLGESSFISEYQDINLLNYQMDWGANANITLFKNIAGNYDNTINDIWVFHQTTKDKFGANDTSLGENETESFMYMIESDSRIFENGLRPYIKNPTMKMGELSSYYETHVFDFYDICKRSFEPYECLDEDNQTITCYNKSASCDFQYWNTVVGTANRTVCDDEECLNPYNQSYDLTHWFLNVTFFSDKFIDPTLEITNITGTGNSENVICEGGGLFCHLNISDTNVVLYMPFDVENDTTTVYDWSEKENDGTIQGLVGSDISGWKSTGGFNGKGAYEFDGLGDNISIVDSSDFAFRNFSISVWIKTSFGGDRQSIIRQDTCSGSRDLWSLAIRDTGNATFTYNADTDLGSFVAFNSLATNLNDSQWHHIVATRLAGLNASLYVDGVFDTNTTDENGDLMDSAATNIFIGRLGDCVTAGNNDYFNGTIDELIVFDKTLTTTDIANLYNQQYDKFHPQGNHTLHPRNLTSNGELVEDSRVNVTIQHTNQNGSNISMRIGQINSSVNLTGLVLYMPFEWGEAWDISGKGNDGVESGDIDFNRSGGVNDTNAYTFQGNIGSINISDSSSINLTENVTVSLWIYPFHSGSDYASDILITKGCCGTTDDFILFKFETTGSTPKNRFIVRNETSGDSATSTINYPKNKWSHLVGTYNGTGITLYYNGGFDASTAHQGNINASNLDWRIGTGDQATESFFGNIDEIMIFNRSLSASEVTALYANQSTKFQTIFYTDYQNMSDNTIATFNISNDSYFIVPDMKFWADPQLHWSPILNQNVTLDTYNVSDVAAAVDNDYPIFSGDIVFPANNTEYSPALDLDFFWFNTTLSNSNGSVGIEFNGINYTMTNASGNEFNFTTAGLGAGTIPYYFWGYGNGTDANYNTTLLRQYTIAQNSSYALRLWLNHTESNITIFNGTTIYLNATVDGNALSITGSPLLQETLLYSMKLVLIPR